jgi:pyrimidine-nucleoside phosphorylase
MIVIPLIERKRDGKRLTETEWHELVAAYARGAVPDYQMAALMMAVRLNGLEPAELTALTDAMCESGTQLRFGPDVPPRVDKHSTGGVGDKVSIVLAPLMAAAGVAVPMVSGRGLAHTGGTLDKLQSIRGFRVDLSLEEAVAQVGRIGAALIGQTAEIAPADRKLYALRDATATVDAIALMAASIMSKKLAEGLNGLVLDIKRGSGAFLPDLDDGLELARIMVRLGADRGCLTVALLTAMDRPLGHACGNAIEVAESIAALRNEGPADLLEVVYRLGVEMLHVVGIEPDRQRARATLEATMATGRALNKFREIVAAQGGDPRVVDDVSLLPRAPVVKDYAATRSGYVAGVEPRRLGQAIVTMGGGRQRMEDAVDPAVGLVVHRKPGDRVERGEPVVTIHARDADGLAEGQRALGEAVQIVPEMPDSALPLISHRVTVDGVEELA